MPTTSDFIQPTQTQEHFSSRKFIILASVFVVSALFGWFRPEFVGTFSVLTGFWLVLLGIYFGANVSDSFVKGKVKAMMNNTKS